MGTKTPIRVDEPAWDWQALQSESNPKVEKPPVNSDEGLGFKLLKWLFFIAGFLAAMYFMGRGRWFV